MMTWKFEPEIISPQHLIKNFSLDRFGYGPIGVFCYNLLFSKTKMKLLTK